MSFSTSVLIRTEAWFDNNTNITTSLIDWYRNRAYAEVMAAISQIYNVSAMVWSGTRSWSPAQILLESSETLIGAGYLMVKQYGIDQMWYTMDEWKDKIAEGRSILKDIVTKKSRLYDTGGVEFGGVWSESQYGPVVATSSIAKTFSKNDRR